MFVLLLLDEIKSKLFIISRQIQSQSHSHRHLRQRFHILSSNSCR
jgi:hypothetical protein